MIRSAGPLNTPNSNRSVLINTRYSEFTAFLSATIAAQCIQLYRLITGGEKSLPQKVVGYNHLPCYPFAEPKNLQTERFEYYSLKTCSEIVEHIIDVTKNNLTDIPGSSKILALPSNVMDVEIETLFDVLLKIINTFTKITISVNISDCLDKWIVNSVNNNGDTNDIRKYVIEGDVLLFLMTPENFQYIGAAEINMDDFQIISDWINNNSDIETIENVAEIYFTANDNPNQQLSIIKNKLQYIKYPDELIKIITDYYKSNDFLKLFLNNLSIINEPDESRSRAISSIIHINEINKTVNTINTINEDILECLEKTIYYLIAQICLPALIAAITSITLLLDKIKLYANNINNIRQPAQTINQNMERFDALVLRYADIIIKYHNDIIQYLNMISALAILEAIVEKPDEDNTISEVFDNNLNIFPQAAGKTLNELLPYYTSGMVSYFRKKVIIPNSKYVVSQKNSKYNEYIEFKRTGENSKILSTILEDHIYYNIHSPYYMVRSKIMNKYGMKIDVPWIKDNHFHDGFIKLNSSKDKLIVRNSQALPGSIYEGLGEYLQIIRRIITGKIIKLAEDDTDGNSITEILKKISNGAENYQDNTEKTNMYLANITNQLLNEMIKYSIFTSSTNWVRWLLDS